MTESSVKFCPHCGSASIKFSALSGGAASCSNGTCGWVGSVDDLLNVPFSHDFLGDEGIALQLMNDLRQLLSGALGLPYLKFLTKWGFVKVDPKTGADVKTFVRYLTVIAKAIFMSVLAERTKIEAESKRLQKVGNDVQ